MSKKKKKIDLGIIKSTELMLNSKGKMGKHDPLVQSGTGSHKSKKVYNRKSKENQRQRQSFKDYCPKC